MKLSIKSILFFTVFIPASYFFFAALVGIVFSIKLIYVYVLTRSFYYSTFVFIDLTAFFICLYFLVLK
jgi:hypothetical protein